MNLLLFGGNSQRNKQWIDEVRDKLSVDFDKCLVHNYDHWQNNEEFISFDKELAKLPAEVKELGEYVVFAKSVGSVLTLKAISGGNLKPAKCVFVGLPIKLAEEDNIELTELLKNNPVPTLFIQNTNDPLAGYSKMEAYIKAAGPKRFAAVELPGDTHSYDDLDGLRTLVRAFCFDGPNITP